MSARRKFNLKRDLLLLKQRIDSQSVFVYNGGMFKANEHLVAYANTIKNYVYSQCFNKYNKYLNNKEK